MKNQMCKVLTGALMMSFACVGAIFTNADVASAKVTVKKVAVNAPYSNTAYVAKGKKIKLATTVTVKPDKAKNKKVTYSSKNKKIATVTAKGVVKGVKAGKTTITVTSKKNKKKKKTIKVVVAKKAITKVKLNSTKASLAVGGKTTLKATVKPAKNASKQVSWKSSNKKVATVSAKGVVKGVKEGSATITCTAADGSKKKATCKVTVGAGIASVSVPDSRIVRVKLSCAKALTLDKFTVQNRLTKNGKYTNATKRIVENIRTTDNINYDVILEDDSEISENSYVKVSIASLVTDKEKEVYVGNIAGYGDAGTNKNTYVTGYSVGEKYSNTWYVGNSNAVGRVTYSVSGLPNGLTAYVEDNKSGITVRGIFKSVQNGTTATLTGVDETGTTFTNKYIFYVGDEKTIVYGVETITGLSYKPDDPKTVKDEESGSRIDSDYISTYNNGNSYGYIDFDEYVHVSGGKSGNVTLSYDISEIKTTDATTGDRIAVPAGTYNVKVTATANSDSTVTKQFDLPIKLVEGVTVSGAVKDAAGNPASYIWVEGHTRSDANDRYHSLGAYTEADGTYSARIIPGDYYVYTTGTDYDNYYLDSIGNTINANITKNITMPVYRVTFTTGISGAVAYENNYNTTLYSSTGDSYYIHTVADSKASNYGQMYAYLKKGSYRFRDSDDEDNYNTVRAYNKLTDYTDSETKQKYYYTSSENLISQNNKSLFKLSGSFTVSGAGSIKLTATPFALVSNSDDEY